MMMMMRETKGEEERPVVRNGEVGHYSESRVDYGPL
jgi:hypothetical protein